MRAVLHTIRWRLIVGSLVAVGIPLILFASVLASRLWDFYTQQLRQELESKAHVVAHAVAPTLSPTTPDNPAALSRIVDGWRRYSNMRVTVADATGAIRAATLTEQVGETVDDPKRPGMREALSGKKNSTTWKSPNFGYEDTMYVNLPVRETDDGPILGVVRVAYSLAQIQTNVGRIRITFMLSVLGYAVLIVLLTIWLAGTIVSPVEQLDESAQELAAGNLSHRVKVQGTDEITHLGATLNRMAERLQMLEGLRRQYVSNVSHELRTPLAAIRGMAETIQQHGETDPDLRRRYLPRIISQTERLARLASQLLDLAQIESGNLISRFAPVHLGEVLTEVTQTCAGGASERGVEVITRVEPDLPPLEGDGDRLEQVFINLIDNAVRHTPPGGSVTASIRRIEQNLEVVIEDTGEGIPAEHLPHLFERFYRVDAARSRSGGGTGLGLSIVEQIVMGHHGSIHVESEVDRGTRFILKLPLKQGEPTAGDLEAAPDEERRLPAALASRVTSHSGSRGK